MISTSVRNRTRLAGLAGFLSVILSPVPGHAGVVNGVQTAEGLTVYLGVVPAATILGHPPKHTEAQMHGGVTDRSIHNMHLVVALFDKASGARVTNAMVVARIFEPGGKQWKVPLQPMMVNGDLTYGGYATFTSDADYLIGVSIRRPTSKRRGPTTVNFTWSHD